MARTSITGRVLLVIYLIILHILAILFIREKVTADEQPTSPGTSPARSGDSTSPTVIDSSLSAGPYALSGKPADYIISGANGRREYGFGGISYDTDKLLIPVYGVKRKDLSDTYTQARSGGRVHNAIDIMAPAGTEVLAVANGQIAKFFDSEQGGITIYQWSADKKYVYYYAHLRSRAAGVGENSFVRRGTVLGYVGDSGNAGTGNFHLHFSVSTPVRPGQHWGGVEINPYPLLKDGIEAPASP